MATTIISENKQDYTLLEDIKKAGHSFTFLYKRF